jgi:hypothetical protein
MTTELKNPSEIVIPYKKVINAFKNRGDVQNGWALAYRPGQNPDKDPDFENWPKTIGQGLTTTGFCVSVSQALLLDNVFQNLINSRGALAKLVSIDIKEQFYGNCYSGTQNKWHTGVLIYDSNYYFVIDLTCRQFGNAFQDKDIWDFKSWEKTFRSPNDKHQIFGFENEGLSNLPIKTNVIDKTISSVNIVKALYDITTITDSERETLSDFLLDKIEILNSKLLTGNVNKLDYKYLDNINILLKHLDFKIIKNPVYCVFGFETNESAKNWIKTFIENKFISIEYFVFSNSIESSCKYFGFNNETINIESAKNDTYIILKLNSGSGFDLSFMQDAEILIPYGIKFKVEKENIYNGGKILSETIGGIEKKTNTIYIKLNN